MKKTIKVSILAASVIAASTVYSCKDEFLDRKPLGAISETSLANGAGANGALIMAYRSLTGANIGAWYTNAYNWVFGSVRSEEAYKGSEKDDQGDLNPIETYAVQPGNPVINSKWTSCYDGVGMANGVLQVLPKATDLSAADALQIQAEARFIRGFHHFEAKRNFNKVPWVDETAVTPQDFQKIKNDTDIYPKIEEDLKFAYDNLDATKAQKGRVNKWAAGAFLGKVYLYQKKYAEAKAVFDNIIANGVTASGEKYGLLDKFSSVFMGDFENSKEIIFGIQYTLGDNTIAQNGNGETELANPHNDGPGGCCGFFQPSQTLANLFRNDAVGLPVANPHATPVTNQENSGPDRGIFDPRIDHTVGRVGVQYLDWGLAKPSWVRNPYGGPYLPMKAVHYQSEKGKFQMAAGWGQSRTGKNTLLMRFPDLLLMAAECEVEVGSLAKALEYVNLIRTRAKNPDDFVKRDAIVAGVPAKVAEADYRVEVYPAFADKADATAKIRHERLLELAMEGHRFYDLVRWGTAETVLDAYIAREKGRQSYLNGADFVSPQDLYLPIPEAVISQGGGNITQND